MQEGARAKWRKNKWIKHRVKYAPDFEGTDATKIAEWSQRYLNKELKPHLMSEELPDDWDAQPVKVHVLLQCGLFEM